MVEDKNAMCMVCKNYYGTPDEVLDHLVILHQEHVELTFFKEGKLDMIFVLREYKRRNVFK